MNERALANWSAGNSLPPDDSLLHKYLPRTKDSLIHLSLNQPHLHLPAALPCALLISLKAFVGACPSLFWTGFMFISDTKALHITLLSWCRAGMLHYSVSVSFYSLKINIAFLYSPDGGADTPSWLLKQKPFISRPSSTIGPNATTLTPKMETLLHEIWWWCATVIISVWADPTLTDLWCTSSHFVV